MIKSMTAYGRARYASEGRDITVEIKSVNGRYFDCTVKMPRTYLFLEDKIKGYLQKNIISRGKIDVFITYRDTTQNNSVSVNMELAQAYVKALREIAEVCGVRDDISALGVARNPDVFVTDSPEPDMEKEWETLLLPLREAAANFDAMRTAEGEKTCADISEKMDNVTAWAKEAGQLSKAHIGGYRDKLEARIRQILSDHQVEIEEQRILTECAIMADKLAVDEELARLDAHREAFFDMLSEGGPCGKKLDFLMQEFNRETNTLGSKANNTQISRLVIAMKNELEKIREQVQNIE